MTREEFRFTYDKRTGKWVRATYSQDYEKPVPVEFVDKVIPEPSDHVKQMLGTPMPPALPQGPFGRPGRPVEAQTGPHRALGPYGSDEALEGSLSYPDMLRRYIERHMLAEAVLKDFILCNVVVANPHLLNLLRPSD